MDPFFDSFDPSGTPILGGYRRKETLNALEKIKNTVLNEERSGQMRTLGVKNEFVRGNARSTLDTKGRRRTILNGFENSAFNDNASSDSDSPMDHHQEVIGGGASAGEMQMQDLSESVYSLGPPTRNGAGARNRSNLSQM